MEEALAGAIRIVLVQPTHPGNIGAVARAMKAMGLADLRLVRPARFPSAEATARAAGADDVLYEARICATLPAALEGCGWVAATSARPRRIGWPELSPRACARRAVEEAARAGVALVFGREHAGLTNEELDHCQAVVRIPTAPGFASLNLAAAVQVLAYEVRLAAAGAPAPARARAVEAPVTAEHMEGFYAQLEQTLVDIGYLDPAQPRRLMRRLRRLFGRTRPDRTELDILRGILNAAQRTSRGRGGG